MNRDRTDLWTFWILVAAMLGMMLAAIAAGGCASDRATSSSEPGCDYDVVGVEIVQLGLYCECDEDIECDGHGQGGTRGTCGPAGVCTIACTGDEDCDGGTCGPDDVRGELVCTEVL